MIIDDERKKDEVEIETSQAKIDTNGTYNAGKIDGEV